MWLECGEIRSTCRIFVRNILGILEIPRRRWKDAFKIDVRGIKKRLSWLRIVFSGGILY